MPGMGRGAAGMERFFADPGDAMASGRDPLPGRRKLLEALLGWGLLKIEDSEAKGSPVLEDPVPGQGSLSRLSEGGSPGC